MAKPEKESFGKGMNEVKGQQGWWRCFWLSGAGAHPLLVLLIGTVVVKCSLWVPGRIPCPLQQVWSGKEDDQRKKALITQMSLPLKKAGTP